MSPSVAPLSRGNVSISSSDTADQPLINPNLLTHPTNQQVAIAAYKRAREVFSAPVMQEVIIGPEVFPGPSVQTDEEILNIIRMSFNTVYHASATNKMGKSADSMAVVDSRCRVYGAERLRVVNASSLPFLPPDHPMSTVCRWTSSSVSSLLIVPLKDALAEKSRRISRTATVIEKPETLQF